jgi:serine protease Do
MERAGTRLPIVLIVFAVIAAACGGGADETTTTVEATTTTSTTTTPSAEEPADELLVSGLENVRDAVVRIVGEGSFVDPEYGDVDNVRGSGSGFIIDPSGIAVTNNHVVTGAAFLHVYVEGRDDPLNAKVLGVSECSDLAVIDIDGDGFPYLDWYDGDITAGMEIYVAGFPLGDPEYTLTEGIISKEKADGETSWASIDSVIEHTARAMGGNSGGPLVTSDGQVVGVHYASVADLDIRYAISRDEASKVLDDLTAGNDVTSIGVNGEAFSGEDFSGIWVAAVESGSPAAGVGIEGGDIITALEGLNLATDGTMADYCDILRSHDLDDPLAIEVLRIGTEEVLEGTLNSGEPLALSFSFAQELGDEVASGSGVSYEYTQITDDDGILVMQVPTTWLDIDGSGWEIDGELVGNAVIATPSFDGFYGTWTTPGVFFGASEVLLDETEPGDLLNLWEFSDSCTYDGTYDYEDAVYTGAYDLWLGCGGTETAFVVLEAYPPDQSFVVLVQVQIVSDADLEAFDVILNTFDVLVG